MRLAEARDAVAVVETVAGEFEAAVQELCDTVVTDLEWRKFLDVYSPVPPDSGRARTLAGNKQDTLTRLWTNDLRVSPWKNTAWGVVQAANTYEHHEATVRNVSRPERNMARAVSGAFDKVDAEALAALQLARA